VRSSVVFPEPIRPVMTVIVPRSSANETSRAPRPLDACTWVRPRTSSRSSRSPRARTWAGTPGKSPLM
jgi:hypothetical protein